MPFSRVQFFILIALLIGLVVVVQISALTLAFYKLGLSANSAIALFAMSLIGSSMNLPLFAVKTSQNLNTKRFRNGYLIQLRRWPADKVVVAVNVGGCLVPVFFCLYLIANHAIDIYNLGIAIAVVTMVSYWLSRPVQGIGITMPILVAPITAALIAITLGEEQRAMIAYISGVVGVLIGADVMRIGDVLKLGAPIASIGGAGTFDGIFITGLVAVLLT